LADFFKPLKNLSSKLSAGKWPKWAMKIKSVNVSFCLVQSNTELCFEFKLNQFWNKLSGFGISLIVIGISFEDHGNIFWVDRLSHN